MSNQIVPNTENSHIARLAIAWDIINSTAAITEIRNKQSISEVEAVKEITNLYLDVFNALENKEQFQLKK